MKLKVQPPVTLSGQPTAACPPQAPKRRASRTARRPRLLGTRLSAAAGWDSGVWPTGSAWARWCVLPAGLGDGPRARVTPSAGWRPGGEPHAGRPSELCEQPPPRLRSAGEATAGRHPADRGGFTRPALRGFGFGPHRAASSQPQA